MTLRHIRSLFAALLSAAVVIAPVHADQPSRAVVAREVPVTSNVFQAPPRSAGEGVQQLPGLTQNSPTLAVSPVDERFVAIANRLDGPDYACALQVSGDRGFGWVPATPVPKLPEGADKCYAPEIAFDRDGTLHFLYVGLQGRGNVPMGAFLTSSSDGARSFSPPRKVLGPMRFQVRMALAQESGRLHLVWMEAGDDPALGGFQPVDNPILSAYSDDGGRTFSKPVRVSDRNRIRAVAPALALGPNGAVHVLYYDLRDDAVDYQGLDGPVWEGRWSLVAATSEDGGRSFGRGRVVDAQVVPPERVMLIFTMAPPTIAVGPGGEVSAAWHDARNGDWDVFMRRSVDRARTWGPVRRLNDDEVGSGRHQYLPRLSSSRDGRVDAIFYDRRRDAGNRLNDVYFASSPDGLRFRENIRLTADPSDSRVGTTYAVVSAEGQIEFGSRLGLFSLKDSALAAWTDTRNAIQGTEQDIFATSVRLPSSAFPSRPATLLASLAAVAAGAAMWAVRRRAQPATRGAEPGFEEGQVSHDEEAGR